MKASTKAIRFLETLAIPEGPKAGELIKLAPFQKKFARGALADDVNVAVLSIGRGNAKSALSAGIALGSAMGKWDEQPRREILIAARTRDQARIASVMVIHLTGKDEDRGARGSSALRSAVDNEIQVTSEWEILLRRGNAKTVFTVGIALVVAMRKLDENPRPEISIPAPSAQPVSVYGAANQ